MIVCNCLPPLDCCLLAQVFAAIQLCWKLVTAPFVWNWAITYSQIIKTMEDLTNTFFFAFLLYKFCYVTVNENFM